MYESLAHIIEFSFSYSNKYNSICLIVETRSVNY